MNILIVDDEHSIADILSDIFNDLDQNATSCYSGNEAIELIKKDSYDLVISDVRMKDGDGPIILDYLNRNNVKLKFVFMTGHSEYSEEDLCNLGALKVFTKPLDFESFTQEILAL